MTKEVDKSSPSFLQDKLWDERVLTVFIPFKLLSFRPMVNSKRNPIQENEFWEKTAATWEREPWILRHDMKEIQYKDYDTDTEHIYTVSESLQPYTIYENNLTHVKGLGV